MIFIPFGGARGKKKSVRPLPIFQEVLLVFDPLRTGKEGLLASQVVLSKQRCSGPRWRRSSNPPTAKQVKGCCCHCAFDCRQASVVPFGSSLVMWLICLQDILLLSFPRDGEQVLDTLPPGCTVEVRNCSHDWLSKLLQLLLEKVKVAWLVFWLVQ